MDCIIHKASCQEKGCHYAETAEVPEEKRMDFRPVRRDIHHRSGLAGSENARLHEYHHADRSRRHQCRNRRTL